MKKITLLTVNALTLVGLSLGSQPLTTHAATPQNQVWNKGNCVIISYDSNCNILNVLDRLENCFPGIIFPGCQPPEGDGPEADTPDCDKPENEAPDMNNPQPDTPDGDIPDTETPEINLPDTDVPETEIPDMGIPETEIPDADIPEADVPGSNTPDSTPGNGSNGNGTPDSTPGNGSNGSNPPEENIPGDSTPDTDDSQDSTGEHAYIKEVVRLVNVERAKEGLAPLTIDTKVQAAAMVRAKECEQRFSHTRPIGTSFATALKEQGVSYRSAGENIAWGQKTPREVVSAWMNSAGHRANIMNASFTTIGVGYYENARGIDYWCQLFTR